MCRSQTVSLFESPKPRREPPPRADVSELPLPDLPPLPPLRRPSVPLVPTIPSPSPATKTTRTLYSTPSQMDLATVAATTIDVYGPPPSPSSLPVAPSDYLPLDAPPPHVSRSPKPGGSSASLASRKSSEHDCEVLGSPTIMAPELLKKSSSSVGVPDTDSVEGSQGSGMAAGREQDMAPGHDTNESSIHETVHVLDQTSLQPDECAALSEWGCC